jgi:hypothetical protein
VEIAGFDLSPPMIALARERLGADADLSVADMTDFDLGRVFDGAISPINALLHLTPEALQHTFAAWRGTRRGTSCRSG